MCAFEQRNRRIPARLAAMTLAQRPSPKSRTLKKLEILSDQLDTAKDASEAATKASEVTTKEVRHARQTVEKAKRDVRQQQAVDIARTRRHSSERYTEDGKSRAAVELGRMGGAARASTLTPPQRSALAIKAAKTRWKKP
jgi:hypothetical protein